MRKYVVINSYEDIEYPDCFIHDSVEEALKYAGESCKILYVDVVETHKVKVKVYKTLEKV